MKIPKLLLVGSQSEPYLSEVEKLIKNKNMKNKIILTGTIDFEHMPQVYNNAKFIIFASRSENCPNILMEAMMAGKAILCSKKYPMPEFGKKGVLYIDANNPKDIYEKMNLLIKNEAKIKYFEKASISYSAKFTSKICADNTWKYLLN